MSEQTSAHMSLIIRAVVARRKDQTPVMLYSLHTEDRGPFP